MDYDVLETDVAIIGGSAAGMAAAIRLADAGAKVTIISKALLGRGGCSVMFGYISGSYSPGAVAREEDQSFPDKIKYYAHYMVDQDFAKAAWGYGRDFYAEMERMGLYIRRTDDGTIVTSGGRGYGPISPKWGTTGKGIMDVMRTQVFSRPISLMEEAMATRIISEDGEVAGVVAYDYGRGRVWLVRAPCVIVCTGHVNYLWARSTATREMNGNGIAMAYRAGAEVEGLELTWFHIADLASPQAWMRLHGYPNPIPMTTEVGRFYNSDGELFFHSNLFADAQPSYYLQCKALARQVYAGKARADGGYYVDFTHVDPRILEEYGVLPEFFRKLGLDISKDRLECAMTCHQMRGGISMDPRTMATRVPGLYVAGSAAADYITGIVTVCYEAKVAAESCLERLHDVKRAVPPRGEVQAELRRIEHAAAGRATVRYLPAQVKREIRSVMWTYSNYFKRGDRLQQGLAELRRIRQEMVPAMAVPTRGLRFNLDLVDALDVEDMLDVGELFLISALTREESRGPFYREDFPYTDNEQWLKRIAIRHDGEAPALRTIPVELTYVRPPDAKADFLTSEY